MITTYISIAILLAILIIGIIIIDLLRNIRDQVYYFIQRNRSADVDQALKDLQQEISKDYPKH